MVVRKRKSYIASLDNISLTLKPGDSVGVIGLNGSGKSTLLRLASGIYAPDEGKVFIEGAPSTLFTSTVGLSVEESAIRIIRDGSMLMNVATSEIDNIITEVIEFAELGRFAHLPMRTYSAGMRARMGFGLATSLETDILLIDEVFGTGDIAFYRKAQNRISDRMKDASIVMIATHSSAIIKDFCNKVLWLDKGQVKAFGDVKSIIEEFNHSVEGIV